MGMIQKKNSMTRYPGREQCTTRAKGRFPGRSLLDHQRNDDNSGRRSLTPLSFTIHCVSCAHECGLLRLSWKSKAGTHSQILSQANTLLYARTAASCLTHTTARRRHSVKRLRCTWCARHLCARKYLSCLLAYEGIM